MFLRVFPIWLVVNFVVKECVDNSVMSVENCLETHGKKDVSKSVT